ncbi:hypothetical protein ACH5RR_033520 [Cinchona calisaya]|uniref:Uncharacterized protein n=1 Tax=Cinchona calisaya TaxID=153742 RepID=A0ABD2YL74_9GENT
MGDYGRRSRGGVEDRFYSPPAMRRQQKTQQQRLRFVPAKRVGSKTSSDDGVTTSSRIGSVSGSQVENLSNLDRFIEHTTPRVPAQFFPKTTIREWRNYDGEFHPYFVLGDLWESFKEWSAYGAGVPLILNGSETVVQYYVPFLSGIQLYIDPSKPVTRQRRPGEESDADSSRETCSDSSGEIGADGGGSNVQGMHRQQNLMGTLAQGLSRISLTNNTFAELLGDENEIKNPPGLLIFEYLAKDQPYSREPLVDKISHLTSQFPDLKTYKSCDLTPASWISVAWYPIYRIPMGPTLQSLDACFLTYHSLSTPLRIAKNKDWPHLHGSAITGKTQDLLRLQLPTFGLASYKFKISFWNGSGGYESQKADSLKQAADNWLRRLQVNHPDYRWFESHYSYWR